MRKQKRMTQTGGSGFLPQEKLSAENDNKPWKLEETEHLLNYYFGMKGALLHCARTLKRGLYCCERQIDVYHYLEEASKITQYHPSKLRENRTGLDYNSAEQKLIECHAIRKVSPKITARILARDPSNLEEFFDGCGKPRTAAPPSPPSTSHTDDFDACAIIIATYISVLALRCLNAS